MKNFRYQRASDAPGAIASVAQTPNADFIAGGTSHVDLMKEGVYNFDLLVDVSRLPLQQITEQNGGLRIGANVKNTALAHDARVQKSYTGLAEAILAGASTQIRNMASTAGNPLQRTRCPYLRDLASPCNKREPGSGCSALTGLNFNHAIFGASPACIAVQPSDMSVALAALDAVVNTQSPNGARAIPFVDFHRLPGDTPEIDTVLEKGELITSIDLPAFAGRSHYLKVRDRASYAYARVSTFVALEMDGPNIGRARIGIGSVALKPWRATQAEAFLAGKAPTEANFRQASRLAFEGANTQLAPQSAYKVPLGQNTLLRCLMETAGLLPLQGEAGTAFASSAGAVAGMEVI